METDGVSGALFAPDSRHIFAWSEDGTLLLWDAETGAPSDPSWKQHRDIAGAEFAPSGRSILVWSDHGLNLLDAGTGEQIVGPLPHEGVKGALFSSDGDRILSWSEDGTLHEWDAATGASAGPPIKRDAKIKDARFSPDDSAILVQSDRTLDLLNATTGEQIGDPLRHEGLRGALFSPDGERILSWSSETLRLWDAKTSKPIGIEMRPAGNPESALFSHDARRILSWSNTHPGFTENATGAIQVWDVTTMEPIGPPIKFDGGVAGATYAQDDGRILSWNYHGAMRLWSIPWRGGDLFQIACAFAPMMSSPQEMDRLSKRYGMKIEEPICQPGVKIPDPDWSRMEPSHAE